MKGPFSLGFLLDHPAFLLRGLTPLTYHPSLLPSSTCSLLLCLSHPNVLTPEQPTGALWACPHSTPLGFPCCPQGPSTALVSLSVPAQVPWAGRECVSVSWCVHGLGPLGKSLHSLGFLTCGAGSVFACMSKGYGQPTWACNAHCLNSVVSKVKLLPRAKLPG